MGMLHHIYTDLYTSFVMLPAYIGGGQFLMILVGISPILNRTVIILCTLYI